MFKRFGSYAWKLAVLAMIAMPSGAVDSSTTNFLKPSQSLDFQESVDVSKFRGVSAQVVYASATPSASTFNEGRKSTATITVAALTGLTTAYATVSITISSITHSSITGAKLVLNNQIITEGIDFFKADVASMTAKSLAAAIDARELFTSTHTLPTRVVVASAATVGGNANTWTATTDNSAISLSAAIFSGGVDAAVIRVHGVNFTNGVDWWTYSSSATTATSIATAINNSSTTTGVTAAAGAGPHVGVVYATASVVGENQYELGVSTPSLTTYFPYFFYGSATGIDITNDLITSASHGLSTGERVLISTPTSGTIPTGLIGGTTYYVIKATDNSYKLATSSTNAVAGTAVDITALAGDTTVTVTPTSLASGTGSFKWQGSNENANWFDLSVTSFTWAGTSSNSGWDFGDVNYKYIRMNFIGPINGALRIDAYLNGKTN